MNEANKQGCFNEIFGKVLDMITKFSPYCILEAFLKPDGKNNNVWSFFSMKLVKNNVSSGAAHDLEEIIRESFDKDAMLLLMKMMKYSPYFRLRRIFSLLGGFSPETPEVVAVADDRGQSIFMPILSNLANANTRKERGFRTKNI
jgi:hypothetical protein